MTKQQTKGRVKRVKGKIKETVGIVTGDKKLEKEGVLQRAAGSVQEAAGKASGKVGQVLHDIVAAVKK
jgi:uncharacterized protein YjbJ (UPF0337 family)